MRKQLDVDLTEVIAQARAEERAWNVWEYQTTLFAAMGG